MKPSSIRNNSYFPYLLLLVQPIFMATNIIVARGGVEYVPPISLAFWRWLTVFLILAPFFLNEVFKKKDFSLIGCQYKHDKIFMPAGFFKKNEDKNFKKNYDILKNKDFIKVDWIAGCSILVNLKKFKHKKLFDDNFFLYFEEYDLCKQLKRFKKKVFLTKKLQIHHYGFKSSSSLKLDFFEDAENLRNWHWMWSSFYYYKKHHGYITALIRIFPKLISSSIKFTVYLLIFKRFKSDIYKHRVLGIINSVLLKKSWYRPKI